MHEPSHAQKAYLARQKRDRCLVVGARLLVFLIFLAQWEIFSRLGWIDSFIFSSPSMIFQTFVKMAQDQSLFVHIGATLKETLLSFAFVVLAGLGISVLLWSCPRLAKVLEPYLVVLNSLPKSALAPLLIVWLGARQRTIIVAGMSVAIFGCILNLYTGFGEVKAEADPHSRRGQNGGASENRSSFLHPSDPCKYEGEHRPLPGGRDHRGIHRRQTGTWVPDHIWQSDIPAGMHSEAFSYSILHISSFKLLFPVTAVFSFLSTSYNESFSNFPSKKKIFFSKTGCSFFTLPGSQTRFFHLLFPGE